eukprot:5456582-Pyramimonas_sp.AAC.1
MRARTSVLDRLIQVGEGPRYRDLVPDRLRGATVQYPCARHARTRAPTARPRRKADARGKPTNRGGPVSAQWRNITARTFPSNLCRNRLDLSRPRPRKKSWSLKPREPNRLDWTEKKRTQ